MKIGEHFTGAELTTTSQPIANEPSDAEWAALGRLVALILDPLREALGRPVRVTSGFRSQAVNRAVGGASTSQHLRGEAADIKVDGLTTTEVARTIHRLRLPVDQCIVERGDGGWVHVSTRLDGKNRGQYLASPKAGQYDPWSP
jgi:hypothetical protein